MNSMILHPAGPGRWTTLAGPEWSNPRGGLWGGYAIGLCLRALAAEPEALGEPLSITITFAAPLPEGAIAVATHMVRQGRSIGVWAVELSVAGSEQVSVHAMVTMAVRPETPAFAIATMPDAPDPATLASAPPPFSPHHPSVMLYERRPLDPRPPREAPPRTLTWVRPREGGLDKVGLAMMTDSMPPPLVTMLPSSRMSTTLTLTAYLHATAEEIAAVGDDFVLVDYSGGVGGGGATDERSSYWRRDGKLLATSEQLAWYRV